ncbi:hypothetical protein DFJ73DRAFT_797225 [Zopfochytrium polystomum]|nr:hypothetical protein DFJ73DRAFT_797225 [Zopfochytrium polystomum]
MRRTSPPRPTTSSRDVAARLGRKYASKQASCLPESSQPIQQEVQGPRRAAGLSDIPASIIFSIFVLLHPHDLVNVRNACYTFKAIRQLPGCMCEPIAGTPGHLPPSFAAAAVARFGLPIEFLGLLHMGLALRLARVSERRLLPPNVHQPSLAELRSDRRLEQVAALSLGLTYLTSGPIRADELPKIPLDALLADSGRVLKVLCLTAAGPWALAEALDRADWAKGARRTNECGGELVHRCVARAALQAAREAGRGDFARVVIERDGMDTSAITKYQIDAVGVRSKRAYDRSVTSIVLLHMVEQNYFDLAKPVAAYWPEFGEGGKERVTVGDLQHHGGGVVDEEPLAIKICGPAARARGCLAQDDILPKLYPAADETTTTSADPSTPSTYSFFYGLSPAN